VCKNSIKEGKVNKEQGRFSFISALSRKNWMKRRCIVTHSKEKAHEYRPLEQHSFQWNKCTITMPKVERKKDKKSQ
jgi:hypothetical protein